MTKIEPISSPFSPEYVHPIQSHELKAANLTDSLTKATVREPPRLTPPSSLPKLTELRLLDVTNNTQNLGNEILDSLAIRLENVKGKIREVSAENMEKLREAAQRASTSNFWDMLKKIATALLSAVSIVFGVSLITTGGGALVGGAMIASGILSLANFALAELGTWDWIADHLAQGNEEQKRKILMYLPGAIGLLAGAMALVGSVQGIATGALNFAEKALFVAQSFLAIFDGVTTFGKGIADARRIWTQSDLSEIQARLLVNQEDFNITLEDVKSSMNDFGDVHKKTKKTIEAIIQSNTQLVRQG